MGADEVPVLVKLSRQHKSAYVSISQHTSAYVSIRQHTSAYVSIDTWRRRWERMMPYVNIRQHTSAYVSIRQHTSAYVSMRKHTSERMMPQYSSRFEVRLSDILLLASDILVPGGLFGSG